MRSKKEKASILSDWRSSGLTQSEFCRQQSLSLSTFHTWLRKSQDKRSISGSNKPSFLEVLTVPEENFPTSSQARFLRVTTSYGLVVEIPL